MVKVEPYEPGRGSGEKGCKGSCECCSSSKAKAYWNYHVSYFFKTLCRKNPDTFTGYELFLIDRVLYRVVPLTFSTERIGLFQKLFIIGQLLWAIVQAFQCYQFHIASLKWIDDTLYTLWEFILWVQFPLFIFFYTLSVKFKTRDKSWLHMVRIIVWFLLFLTIIVFVATLSVVSDFPLGLMEDAWNQNKEFLHRKEKRPGWMIDMQRPLECCGFREPNDWLQGRPQTLPYTCCPTATFNRNCTLKNSFHQGCLWSVKELYLRCKPFMWKGALVNMAVLVVNYGLFRYLFKRNYQGWQVDMTYHEALLPVLRFEATHLPTGLKKPPPTLLRMTESEAVIDMMRLVHKTGNPELKAQAQKLASKSNTALANI